MAGAEEDHEPPDVAQLKVMHCPAQTLDAPVIAAGAGDTVTALVTKQQVPNE
jgi:hypothetical protein